MIYVENCLSVMESFAADSVDSIVTDPPYGLSFMGKEWDHGVPGVLFWLEALRVAKPGCHLLAFGGTRTFHRLMVAIEDAGWEIRDTIMWVYGSGFPKSHNGQWGGTALKPAWEPIIVARKPLMGTVAKNVQEYGTGALNIDGCRVGDFVNTTPPGTDRYNQANYEHGYRPNAYQGNGRDGEASAEKRYDKEGGTNFAATPGPRGGSPAGRFPANLIHDGSDEVLAGFPETGKSTGGRTANISKTSEIYGGGKGLGQDIDAETVRGDPGFGDSGSAARFFYCAKASKSDRTMNGQVDNKHPTVKPNSLMRYLCKLVTPPNGLVLDPFCGSGSTGVAAVQEGFRFVGIEKDEDSAATALERIRIAAEVDGLPLFNDDPS